jgi:hypothetical protein
MTIWLRQSTAATVMVGPFVDETDGFTAETGLTLAGMNDAEAIKTGSGSVVDIAALTFTHVQGGQYTLALTSSETDTLGRLRLFFRDAGVSRPLFADFMVVPANVYDSLVLGSDTIYADAVQISGSATAADKLEAGATGLVTGTCSTGSTTTVVNTNLTETTNDHYNGRTLTFTSGNLDGQSTLISDYNGSTKALSVATLTESPADTDTFVIA